MITRINGVARRTYNMETTILASGCEKKKKKDFPHSFHLRDWKASSRAGLDYFPSLDMDISTKNLDTKYKDCKHAEEPHRTFHTLFLGPAWGSQLHLWCGRWCPGRVVPPAGPSPSLCRPAPWGSGWGWGTGCSAGTTHPATGSSDSATRTTQT